MSTKAYFQDKFTYWLEKNLTKILYTQNAGQSVTYERLWKLTSNFKNFLTKNNIKNDEAILMYIPRGLAQACYITCLVLLEFPAVVISYDEKSNDIFDCFEKLPFKAILTLEECYLKKTNSSQSLEKILSNNKKEKYEIANYEFDELFKDALLISKKELVKNTQPFAWGLLTSGSTGEPKIVVFDEKNLISRTEGEVRLFDLKNESRFLNILSMGHDLGLNQILTTIITGSTLYINTRSLAKDFAELLLIEKFDGVVAIPEVWKGFLSYAKNHKVSFLNPGFITVSGGSLDQESLKALKEQFVDTKIIKTYGQTETFRSLACTDQAEVENETLSPIIDGVKPIILDKDNEMCKVGEVGQLIHCGNGSMLGYWCDEVRTAAKLKNITSSEKAIMTGDYFEVVAENKYKFLGREDDLIKIGGNRFFLSEIETSAMNSGQVESICCVKYLKNDRFGNTERLGAAVVFRDQKFKVAELLKYFSDLLPSYKVPREILSVNRLPLTKTGKISRNKVRELFIKLES